MKDFYKSARNLLVLAILFFVIAGCRTGKVEIVEKKQNASIFNPYRGQVENLLIQKVSGQGDSDWEIIEKKQASVDGAIDAVNAVYEERYGSFNSYQPRKITILIANFSSAEAAHEYFKKNILNGAAEDNVSSKNKIGDKEVGRKIITDKHTVWTNGSLFCESSSELFRKLVSY
jgi:hypothetical protein